MIEGMVWTNTIESGRSVVLELMLDIIMDVDDSALLDLTQILQTFRFKNVPRENVCTTLSHLKGFL